MATTLYLRNVGASLPTPGVHTGNNDPRILDSTGAGWISHALETTRGGGVASYSSGTSSGPVTGLDLLVSAGVYAHWISPPLAAAVTISGTITFNIWASETNMSANVAINCIIERMTSQVEVASQVIKTTRTTEVAVTTNAVNNFTGTPTSTDFSQGDRIRIRIIADDSTANMGASFAWTASFNGSSAAADGDTFVTFTENLTFMTTEPSGTQLFLTSTDMPAPLNAGEREMWTTRGGSATTSNPITVTGWTIRNEVGLLWLSRQLNAFTLDGLVRVNLRLHESNTAANVSVGCRLAIVNADGTSGETTWGAAVLIDSATPNGTLGAGTDMGGELTTSEAAVRGWLAGPATSVSTGQRLMLRWWADDTSQSAQATGHTSTLTYNGPTGGASGDSWIQLPQSVTEYFPPSTKPHVLTHAVHRSYNW